LSHFFGHSFGRRWHQYQKLRQFGHQKNIEVLSAWEVPFLNTLILLSSGATVTWAHHAVLAGHHRSVINGLVATIILASIFTALQGFEYVNAGFTISDSIYGSTF